MGIDWLWPLLVGALLTGAIGALERSSVRRYENRRASGKHVSEAFALATRLAQQIHDARSGQRFASEPIDPEELSALRKLRELDERLPRRRLRIAIRNALNIVGYAPWIHQLGAWDSPAGQVQEEAAVRLRRVLGAAERGGWLIPRSDAAWLRKTFKVASAAVDRATSS